VYDSDCLLFDPLPNLLVSLEPPRLHSRSPFYPSTLERPGRWERLYSTAVLQETRQGSATS
jgi:hypothetical protein